MLTMLEKGKGPYIDKLRIIQLVEADLNWIFSLIWSKRLEYKLTKEQLLDSCQFATQGQRCQSAALNIRLVNDIQRQVHESAALESTELKMCFDRSLPAMVITVSMRMGIPETAAHFLYRTLYSQSFQVTGYGILEECYSAMEDPIETRPRNRSGSRSVKNSTHHHCRHHTQSFGTPSTNGSINAPRQLN